MIESVAGFVLAVAQLQNTLLQVGFDAVLIGALLCIAWILLVSTFGRSG